MPRNKLFKRGMNLNLHLSAEMVQRLDHLVQNGETRTDILREAIRREIARREARQGKRKP